MKPSVGRTVHYVSSGSADGHYPSVCRAAIVTEVERDDPIQWVGLMVANPTGINFVQEVPYDEGHDVRTWHWPEREE